MLMSLAWHKAAYARYADKGDLLAQSTLFLFTTFNASMAAAASYASGLFISWLWGI